MPSVVWRQRTFLYRAQTNGCSFEITRTRSVSCLHDGSDCSQAPPELGMAGVRSERRADHARARAYPAGCPLPGVPEPVHAIGHRPAIDRLQGFQDFLKN